MERTIDVDTQQVTYNFTALQLLGAALIALVIGFMGALGGKLYERHNEQHAQAEHFQRQQEQINREFAGVINQLLQRGTPPPK